MGRKRTTVGEIARAYAEARGVGVSAGIKAMRDPDKRAAFLAEMHNSSIMNGTNLPLSRKGDKLLPLHTQATQDVADDVMRAGRVKENAYIALHELETVLAEAMRDNTKKYEVQSLARAVRDARKNWEDACRHEQELRKGARLLIPVGRVRDLRSALAPLVEAVMHMRKDIYMRLRPDTRREFLAAFERAREKWNAGISHMEEQIETILPCLTTDA